MQDSPSQKKEKVIDSQLIKIFIVDDQEVVRAKLQDILSSHQHIKIVGVFDDAERALAKIELLEPDVVLIDIEMPKMDGMKLTRIISQKYPQSKILILSIHKEDEYAQKSISAGASGYISKLTSAENLVKAISTVHQGYSHFGLETLKKVQSQLVDAEPKTPPMVDSSVIPQIKHQTSSSIQEKSKAGKLEIASAPIPPLPMVKVEEFLPPISKWLNWSVIIVVGLICSGIPVTSLLKYKTKVKTTVTVRPLEEINVIQSATEGKVIDISVKQGQEVQSGDIIAKIDPSRWQTRKNQLSKAIAQQKLILNQLNSQITIVKSQVQVETDENEAQILAAQAELEGNQRNYSQQKIDTETTLKEAQAQVKAAQARLKAAEFRLTRYESVGNIGALSLEQIAEAQLEVDQEKQSLQSANANLESAKAALEPSASEVEIARQRINQTQKSGQANIARLNQEQEALLQQRIAIAQQLEQDAEELTQVNIDLKNTKITATKAGIVSDLSLQNPGQSVQPGQEIAQIIPSNAGLEIKAAVSPQDIGKLETEQKVQMRISACSYTDYGVLEGKVNRIAKDTRKPQNNNASRNSPSSELTPAFYEISVIPNATFLVNGKKICSLQLGMEGTADIITQEESVMRFLLRKARLISNI